MAIQERRMDGLSFGTAMAIGTVYGSMPNVIQCRVQFEDSGWVVLVAMDVF